MLPLLALAAAGLAAPAWPGATGGGAEVHELVIPAGALQPGVARVEVAEAAGQMRHVVHARVVAGAPTRVRLWVGYDLSEMAGEEVLVRATGEAGDTWEVARKRWQDAVVVQTGTPLFRGEAEALTAFLDGVDAAARGWRQRIAAGLQLADPATAPDCRALAVAPWVVADASVHGDALVGCAARGARIVLLGGYPPAEVEAGTVFRWGRGLLAWAEGPGPAAGAAAVQMSGEGMATEASWIDWFSANQGMEPDGGPPLGALGVLGLLLAYVAVIGPVGYLAGIRPRRAWVAWGWFPAVSGLATAGSVSVGLAWQDDPSVRLSRVTTLSPEGQGLRMTHVQLLTPYGEVVSLDTPWADADLASFWVGGRFGGPFGDRAGPLRIVEDQERGVARFHGLTSSSFGGDTLAWVAPFDGDPVRVEDGAVVNRGRRPVAEGVLVCGGRSMRFGAIEPGGRLPFRLEAVGGQGGEWSWRATVESQADPRGQLGGSYVLAVRLDGEESDGVVVGGGIPVVFEDLLLTAGPLPEAP